MAMLFILQLMRSAKEPAMCITWRTNCIAKQANFSNNGAREIEFGSPDGGDDSEYIDIGFVERSNVFGMQEAFVLDQDHLIELIL